MGCFDAGQPACPGHQCFQSTNRHALGHRSTEMCQTCCPLIQTRRTRMETVSTTRTDAWSAESATPFGNHRPSATTWKERGPLQLAGFQQPVQLEVQG